MDSRWAPFIRLKLIDMTHPLSALSAEEIEKAVNIFKKDDRTDNISRFSYVNLLEPSKEFTINYKPGDPFDRELMIVGIDSSSIGFEAKINLTQQKVEKFEQLTPSAQPTYNENEIFSAIMLVLENKDYIEALKKRDIKNLDLIQIDPWPGGGMVNKHIKPGHRALKAISFIKESPEDNAYARPITGLIAHVDLTEMKVVEIEDHGVTKIPDAGARYDQGSQEFLRTKPKEINITQPNGTGFEVEDNFISWEGWNFRVSIDPISGLVLHNVTCQDRPILYRAAMSEMVVPYGSSDPMHSWKAVHDGTEYAFGSLANSLKLGCDCLGEIFYIDSNQLNSDGTVKIIENAICLHEEDFGIQWKHSNTFGEGFSEARRSRRLVISSFSTVGNYDYGVFWYLYLDGTIQLEMKLTGIVGVSAFNEKVHNDAQDMRLTEEIVSPIHQHLFNVRLDWFLDGGENQLFEINVKPVSNDFENSSELQFQAISKHLKNENEAKRNIDPSTSRTWKIVNGKVKNKIGNSTAYKILPGNSPTLMSGPKSIVGKRASFAKHNLWATPYEAKEMYAAGTHTVMHGGEGGLSELTSKNRDISECDLVTWITFGVTHIPRPEDWPVMPVEYCGFHLIPTGFFDKNPTINLPSDCNSNSKSNKD